MMIFSGRMAKGSKRFAPLEKRFPGEKVKVFRSLTGFTFLEILVAIILLVVGFSSILQVFSMGLFADADVESHTTALYLAQEKMEEIKDSATYAGINSFASARASLTGNFADFDREVIVSGNPKQVNVIVYWDVKGVDQNINLVSLFANYDY